MPELVLPCVAPSETVAAGWADREERYLEGRYAGAGGQDSVRVLTGSVPVLFTAPHAVTHRRHNAAKPADIATGGLAETLAEVAGAHALAADGMPGRDPNYDAGGVFKAHLAGLLPRVRTVVDLHGMKDSHGVDVCLGRGLRPQLADPLVAALAAALRAHGFTVAVDAPFNAAREHTVTSTVQAAGVAGVQVELSRRLRNPWDAPLTAAALVAALAEAAGTLAG